MKNFGFLFWLQLASLDYAFCLVSGFPLAAWPFLGLRIPH